MGGVLSILMSSDLMAGINIIKTLDRGYSYLLRAVPAQFSRLCHVHMI